MAMDNLISRDKNGTFCVLFKNKSGLTEDEINEIFSQFGKVFNIRCTGDAKGFRFVRYKYQDEAERAIIGLKDHPSIKFSVPKDRQQENSNGSSNRNDNYCNGSGTNENDDNWNSNNTNENSRGKTFSYQNKNSNYQKKNSYQSKNSSKFKGDSESVKSDSSWGYSSPEKNSLEEHNANSDQNKNSNYQKRNAYQSTPYNKHKNYKDDLESIKSDNSYVHPSQETDSLKEQNLHFDKLAKTIDRNTLASRQSTSTHSSIISEHIDKEEIPDLVLPTKKIASQAKSVKKVILNAEEVIVGNIHPEYTVPYILHLFDRFEPLGISVINTVPNTKIRYCHVYFKSLQDSIAVETHFDQTELSGQKLVVLRPCSLFAEAI